MGPQWLGEDVEHRKPWVERRHRVLEHDLQVAPDRLALGSRLQVLGGLAEDDDLALLRLDEVEDLQQRRRLAAPRLADEAERLALPDVEVDVVDGVHGADALLEHGPLGERELLDEPVDPQYLRALLPRQLGDGRLADVGKLEDVAVAERAGGDLAAADACDTVIGRIDLEQFRLGGATRLDGHRAAGHELASRRQVQR